MKKLIIMRGLPGSGKSTAAHTNANTYDAVILASDDYFMINGTYCFDMSRLGDAHAWTKWRCAQLFEAGKSIVIDNTNTVWKELQWYAKEGLHNGYEVVVSEPVTPWAKNVAQCFETNTHSVPIETIQRMSDRFESSNSIREKIEALSQKVLS